jgi:3-oxoadipate enol-lactonase
VSSVPGPPLPPGRLVDLPGRGRTWVREIAGRPGAPTVLLLHGWTANADLNWFSSFHALQEAGYHVVALDHRGHGRGIRTWKQFRMRDAADDAVALLDVVGVRQAIVVGYSMGGAVAQLVWRRHPERVLGLVLCATSSVFAESEREKRWFAAMTAMSVASRVTPGVARRAVAQWVLDRRQTTVDVQWMMDELHRNDWTAVLGAGAALGRFDSRPWLAEIDVPTAVVHTRFDRVVPPFRQRTLSNGIPGAVTFEIDGDHSIVATAPGRFVPALLSALRSVSARQRASAV